MKLYSREMPENSGFLPLKEAVDHRELCLVGTAACQRRPRLCQARHGGLRVLEAGSRRGQFTTLTSTDTLTPWRPPPMMIPATGLTSE